MQKYHYYHIILSLFSHFRGPSNLKKINKILTDTIARRLLQRLRTEIRRNSCNCIISININCSYVVNHSKQ